MINAAFRHGNGKYAAALLAALAALYLPAFGLAITDLSADDYYDLAGTYSIKADIPSYEDYIAALPDVRPQVEYTVNAADCIRYEESGEPHEPVILTDYEGVNGIAQPAVGASQNDMSQPTAAVSQSNATPPLSALLTSEDSLVEYELIVAESGLYDIELTYYPCEGRSSEIQRAFFLDGALPYGELALVEFSRIWVNNGAETAADGQSNTTHVWRKDNQGNDLKPGTIEAPEWLTCGLRDSNGYILEQLSVYLEAGTHTLTILSLREPMLLGSITLKNTPRPQTYTQALDAYRSLGVHDTDGLCISFEAEDASKTSSQMLYPRQDSSSPSLSPSSARYLLNNTIGGNSWRQAGQWIEWGFDVPEDGLYCLTLHDKQSFVRGVDVCRKVYIDGEVPYDALSAYPFAFSQGWRMETLRGSDGEPLRLYLAKGAHTLRMEVVLGDMASIISRVQKCVRRLNSIYRQVIYIIGVAPDKYRDYQIEACLPGLKDDLIAVRDELALAIDALRLTAGGNTDKLAVLLTMSDQLNELIADGERFTEVITSYKINVRACGNWITQVLGQPLQLDRIYVHSPDVTPSAENNGWLDGVAHELKRLYYSFVIDFNQVGNVASGGTDSPVITLWVGTGRDQATVIKSLIDEGFTAQSGIEVNVQLVDMNALLRATLSGQGPDLAIQVSSTNAISGAVLDTGNDTPVNYGLRNAVYDLTRFDDFDTVKERFMPSALVPFSFGGAVYALPDTQTFPMLFYRKDILAEIGLEVPQTWDDVKVAMSVLSKNQMEFGMLPSEQIFAMLLYQNGGVYYTDNGDRSMLDSDAAVSTFKKYCEYYTDYKLDKATSVEERFRTGECPIIISDYTTYNNLQVSAPDIFGLWDFAPVPGTVQADGSISRAVGGTGLADIIMADTEHPEACWEFLKWWTSADTQTAYGREMESLMGKSARVATANIEALPNLSWPLRVYRALSAQMGETRGIPQVPGGYYSWRNVNNAFFSVAEDKANRVNKDMSATPREELMDKVLYINAEIDYKRVEFDLPLADR